MKALKLFVSIVMVIGLFSCGHNTSEKSPESDSTEITNTESVGNNNENDTESDNDIIRIEDSDYTN